jgi:hypothetical protein
MVHGSSFDLSNLKYKNNFQQLYKTERDMIFLFNKKHFIMSEVIASFSRYSNKHITKKKKRADS